jgi:1,2-diacylglycerol 3-alpha-glucosyltransferase
MHIAHFTNTYYPVISGVVRSVSSFRQALTRLGHNVFVFAQEENDYEDQEPFIFRYPSIHLPLAGDFPAVIPISSFIDQLLPTLKLDVIHTHHPVLLGQAAAKKAGELNLPLVFTFHTQYREYSHYFPLPQEVVQEFVKGAIDNYIYDFLKKCHHVVVPTPSMLELVEHDYGLIERVTIIPTGLDLAPYKKADGEPVRAEQGWNDDLVMISVGRLAAEKNWPVLLEAAAIVLKTNPNLRVVLIGSGPERDSLEEFVDELGISPRVDFMGTVPFEEIPAYLKAADFFGFASVSETQGLVSLEALSAGLPVVAVDATGTKDVVEDGVVGLLTEDDPHALAGAIKRILDEPDLLARFKSNAMNVAAEYDILKQAKKLVDVYRIAQADQKAGKLVKLVKPEPHHDNKKSRPKTFSGETFLLW